MIQITFFLSFLIASQGRINGVNCYVIKMRLAKLWFSNCVLLKLICFLHFAAFTERGAIFCCCSCIVTLQNLKKEKNPFGEIIGLVGLLRH